MPRTMSGALTRGMRAMEIRNDTTILAILECYPEAGEVFASLGMRCVGCLGAEQETVETSARMHGLTAEAILDALNAALSRRPGSGS